MPVIKVLKHLVVWVLILLVINNSDWTWQGFSTEDNSLLIPSLYGTLLNALVFYGNVNYLYPRFWRNRKRRYFVHLSLWLIGLSLFEGFIDLQYSQYTGVFENFKTSLDISGNASPALYKFLAFLSFSFVCLTVHILFAALSFGYLMPLENMRNISLQNARLKSELKYLKAQIDPHTLFNGINGIYHLIDEEPDLAKEYLHGFANILRYHLYDCQEDLIPISKEMEFLDRFLQLSSLRVKDDAIIQWELPKEPGSGRVAPQLFLPFIENAFKHLSDHDDPDKNTIHCSLSIEEKDLHFHIRNSYAFHQPEQESHGLGLENVRSRLELLYPKSHELSIGKKNGYFSVDLRLTLDD